MRSYIERHPNLEGVGYYRDANLVSKILMQQSIDLIFCDIEMPTINGIDFVESFNILEPSRRPMVIFTTAYSEYALEGFRLEALDYLLKPFSYADFERAVMRASNLSELKSISSTSQGELHRPTESEGGFISVKSNHKTEMISYDDILYIESESEYIRIVCHDGRNVVTLFRLKNIENELPSTRFARIHRCYIVGLHHVSSYDRARVYLGDKIDLPIGQSFRDGVVNALQSLAATK